MKLFCPSGNIISAGGTGRQTPTAVHEVTAERSEHDFVLAFVPKDNHAVSNFHWQLKILSKGGQ